MLAGTIGPEALRQLDARAVVDILLIAAVVYGLLRLLGGTRAAQTALGLLLIVLVYYGARWTRLEMVEWLLANLLPYAVIALIVLFQPEIRRVLAHLGSNAFWRLSAPNPVEVLDDVVMAATHFHQHRIGALIVLEREVSLKTYVESGIPLDAAVSYDLLLAIFRPESPLHDGAAIIQKNRLAGASCFLPLSLSPVLSTQLGTRHRAALGITEDSDAVAIVVSEETGKLGLAADGTLELDLTPEQLTERLGVLFARYRPAVALPSPPGVVRTAARK